MSKKGSGGAKLQKAKLVKPTSNFRNRKFIKLGLAALLVLPVIAVALRPQTSCAHSVSGGQVIHLDEKGFDPKNLTITTGTKVVFENTGFNDVWPASDDHPTHEKFSAFDPKKPVLAGESWEFTFNEPGTYGMHDHLNPQFTGEIVVTGEKVAASEECKEDKSAKAVTVETAFTPPAEPNASLPALMNELKAKCQAGDHSCTEQFVGDVIAKHGAKPALELYRQAVAEQYVSQEGDGHQVAHRVGRKTAQVYGVSYAAFDLCDTSLNYGCQHGYFEYVIGRVPSAYDAMDLICGSIGKDKPHKALAYCYHGAGHGIMMAEGNDVDRSLAVCASLPAGDPQNGCYQGVFMENTNAGMRGEARSGVFDTNNLLMPCVRLDEKFQHSCYESLAGWIAIHRNNVEEVTAECVKAPTQAQIRSCLLGIGLMSSSPDWQPQLLDADNTADIVLNTKTFCQRFPDEYELGCIEAGISTFSNFDQLDVTRSNRFCSLIEEQFRRVCYQAMHHGLYSNAANPEEVTKACSIVDSAWRSVCSGT